jgi:polyhydroxyalkanoate synthesis repressor PhaR
MTIIIKRYRNRKLYNTQSKRYITLEEIEGLIKQQIEIKVVENDTGNDITATTLSQIIFDLEKNQTGVLPVDLLFSLVQSGGKRFDEIRRNIFTSLNFPRHFNDELDRRVKTLISSGEITEDDGRNLLAKLHALEPRQDSLIVNMEEKILGFLKEQEIPTRSDLQILMDQLDDLSHTVEELSSSKDIETKTEVKKSDH